jgi:hypothetical protein
MASTLSGLAADGNAQTISEGLGVRSEAGWRCKQEQRRDAGDAPAGDENKEA